MKFIQKQRERAMTGVQILIRKKIMTLHFRGFIKNAEMVNPWILNILLRTWCEHFRGQITKDYVPNGKRMVK